MASAPNQNKEEGGRGVAGIQRALLSVPLLGKVLGIALGMTFFLLVCVIWQLRHSYLRLELGEVETNARLIAETLAVSATPLLSLDELSGVQTLVDDMARAHPSIHSIEVRDGRGRLVAHTGPVQSEASLIEAHAALAGDPPGQVSVLLNHSHVNFEVDWHTRRLIVTTTVVGLIGLIVTWRLMRLVTRPVQELVGVTRAVKAGDYEVRAKSRARDEVGQLAGAFNDMMDALEQKEAINRQLLRKLLAAEENERKRIALELHDHTGQALTALIASLASLDKAGQDPELNGLLNLATQTLGDVHELSRTLRPDVLDEAGVIPALRKLCEAMAQRPGLKVDFTAVGLEENTRLPAPVELALYRIGQEALTNAVRHGQAQGIEVLIHRKSGSVLAVIEDDGRGFDAADWRVRCLNGDHLGLLGIEERACLLGGNLRVESRPGAGTSLFVEIPLSEDRHV